MQRVLALSFCATLLLLGCGKSSSDADGASGSGGSSGSGTGGTAGSDAGPTCAPATPAYLPWQVTILDPTTGGPCKKSDEPPFVATSCQGTASVETSSGQTVLRLSDESTFTWTTDPAPAIGVPAFGGETVELEYTHVLANCGAFCQHSTSSMTLRRADGALVFVSSSDTSALADALEQALGLAFQAEEVCSEPVDDICYLSGTSILSDFRAVADPTQVLHYDAATTLVTPNGEFEVAYADPNWVDLVHDPNVADCGNVFHDTAYVIRRTKD